MKITLIIIIYVILAVWTYRTEGVDKDGVYHRSGYDKTKADKPKDYLGRVAYALIAPFIVAVVIGFLLGY